MAEKRTPTLLVILDGWGIAPPSKGNAIYLAKTPTMDRLYKTYPSTTLGATGEDVGLEKNQMSGSEAGHMNIGAGRIVKQDSKIISESIRDGSFFLNPAFVGAMNHVKKNQSRLHILGLMGNTDSPHSNPEHFRALLRMAKRDGVREVFCHLFSDGRDSYPKSALTHLAYFRKIMAEEGAGRIATLTGRYYAMDRAKHWNRLTLAYDAMVFGRGEKVDSPEAAIEAGYKKNLTDEYILPSVISENGEPIAKISKNDAVIFFNLRSDRARQMTKLFATLNKERVLADDMPIIDKIDNLYFAAMSGFGPDLSIHTAFSERSISVSLPMILGDFRQLYMAELEKFAHVTYFINGGYMDSVSGERRIMIEPKKDISYVKNPEMSAPEITESVIKYMQEDAYDFIAVNYANADMVGHTGDLAATIKAVEVLDQQVNALEEEVLKRNGTLIIIADHGNADDMIDFETEQPNTFHTKNPVPFILVGEKFKNIKLKDGGILGNVVPTILDIMGIKKPKLMECDSLLG